LFTALDERAVLTVDNKNTRIIPSLVVPGEAEDIWKRCTRHAAVVPPQVRRSRRDHSLPEGGVDRAGKGAWCPARLCQQSGKPLVGLASGHPDPQSPIVTKVNGCGNRSNPVAAFAAAEAIWILSGSDAPWIYQYNKRLADYADDGRLMGAYGPRLRRWHGTTDQLALARTLLASDPDTRRAVIQLYAPEIDAHGHKDVPCTLGYRFFLRDGLLHMHTTMRSQDLWLGFCYDIFTATILQELPLRVLRHGWPRVTAAFISAAVPPRDPGNDVTQAHADLAAALQERTEQVMTHLAARARELTGAQRLCLGGGVAMNCVGIGKIIETGQWDQVYVPPAPGDSGTPIGAALAVSAGLAEQPSHGGSGILAGVLDTG
jgi:hypothetical protein